MTRTSGQVAGSGRALAALPLAIPGLAGLAYLASAGAPHSYVLINAGALTAGTALAAFAPELRGVLLLRVLTAALLTILFLPLLTGPSVQGVERWLPRGPLTVHSGMLVLPALAVLAARDPDYAAPILLASLFAAFLQPDAATGFAITFAAVALHDVTRDWRVGVAAILAFFATLMMAVRGELPPQKFVERIFVDLLVAAPLAAAAVFLTLVAAFFLMLWCAPAGKPVRYAMAGALFGFVLMALLSHYPTPLVGYGAAPIIGFGLALWLGRGTSIRLAGASA